MRFWHILKHDIHNIKFDLKSSLDAAPILCTFTLFSLIAFFDQEDIIVSFKARILSDNNL